MKKSAIGMPPQPIKGSAVKKNKKKGMGKGMVGLFGVTSKKPEVDNAPQKRHAMRTARLSGKLI